MIAYDDALARILAACSPLPAETVATSIALARVLAQDVVSAADLPPFDNTAMDGFALATGGAELAAGNEFVVAGSQAAGDGDAQAVVGAACEIMTGASLPAGLDAVVPVEQVAVLARDGDGRPCRIRLQAAVVPGAHVRRRGQDVARGQTVLRAGTRLVPAARMLLAALGVAEVAVRPQVPVALLSTGRELVDDPRQPLAPGQIRNSNGPYLGDRLAEAGAAVVHRETVADDPQAFVEALQRALAAGAQVLLSTGAVSMGRYDFVPDALRGLGAELVFHKVAIRPGKPLLFARLRGGQLYFGLPGNPVSSAVGLRFFVEPALRALLGQAPECALQLPLAAPARKKPGLRFFQKARVALADDGRAQVQLLAGQESFRIQPLLAANAWAVLAEDAAELPAGAMVAVYGLGADGVLLAAQADAAVEAP
ncbi:gephyrin-like molybdotransferase Glp [Cognatiluteimonas weifangensis]|uniref:Molybdopterin molybdenumtransferase n=1 Tax=Cognatiluteimonas weifangensis TaxID=2303539 RepID=A0A372DMH6_9GAMM|nr:gephyrin-like molybdotransferase Glp [Luteimonas weifangensis]RFP60791.1 molybdopterin molybdenumtransferase MoeA [Luteimonas weifangensis]